MFLFVQNRIVLGLLYRPLLWLFYLHLRLQLLLQNLRHGVVVEIARRSSTVSVLDHSEKAASMIRQPFFSYDTL